MRPVEVRRVLQVHARYRQTGGEERVVEDERRLLEASGIEVDQVLFDNANLREASGAVGDVRMAASAIWSAGAYQRVAAAIVRRRPDVVHVHNTFAAASPSVLRPSRHARIPTVQTLHNYRLVCPKATLFRDGRVCVDCVGMPLPLPAVIHSCVRHSRPQSAVAAATLATHRALGTYRHASMSYIALTAHQREVLVSGGMDPDSIHVVPNFLEPDPGHHNASRSAVLFVGRLAVEKGIEPLLRSAAVEPGIITVAGEGPLVESVERAASRGDVAYLGPLSREDVGTQLTKASVLVVPSLWFEGFPMVVLEAYAAGTAVLANRIGSLAEVVEDGLTGILVDVNDVAALATAIRWFHDHPVEARAMGERGRKRYEERYRGGNHLAQLLDVYRDSIRRLASHG